MVGQALLTPQLSTSGVRGTRRARIIDTWAPALDLKIEVCALTTRDLEEADEVFFCNSLIGLRPVASFGQRQWTCHKICEALHGLYVGELS